jgi:hypothetical protein
MSAACKTDIYFLADNTGSMLSKIQPIQTNIISLLASIRALTDSSGNPFDVAFGVGQFNDFPVSIVFVTYGGSYDPTQVISVSIPSGSTVTLPIGPGPLIHPPNTWPGAPTVPLGSFISGLVIPSTGNYQSIITLRGDGGRSGGHMELYLTGTVSGVVYSDTFIDLHGGVPPYDPWNYPENSPSTFGLIGGETLSVTLKNSTPETVNIHWSTIFCIEQDPAPYTGAPFALNPQLDINAGSDAAVAVAVRGWIGEGGGDSPESLMYCLDQLSNGLITWRAGANKIIFVISSSPGHEVTCPAISSLGYTITRASTLATLQANSIRFVGMSTPVSGPHTGNDGIDDDLPVGFPNDYDAFCGHVDVLAGQGTEFANNTGGAIEVVNSNFDTHFLSFIESITAPCRNPSGRRRWVTLVGAT